MANNLQIKTKSIKLGNLKLFPKNPKKHWEEGLLASLKEAGYVEAIVVDENDVILAGHGRLKALLELGHTKEDEIDVIVKEGLTQKQKEKYVIVSNQTGIRGGWDIDLLKEWDEELLEGAGFKSEELDDIFGDVEEDEFDAEEEYEKIVEPKAKLGDLYQLGSHRLLCGDATKKEDVERLMGGEKAKLIFTSPPYNMGGKMYEDYEDNLKSEEYIKFNLKVIKNCKEFLRGFIFWNISYNKNTRWEFIEIIYKIVKETGLKFLELIVWDKGHALPINSKQGLTRQYEDILLAGNEDDILEDLELYFCGRNNRKAYFNKKTNKGITNYWRITTNKIQLKNHLACFPIALPARGIELMTSRGEIVLDPFFGSGTTLIASEKNGRRCYGIEIDPKYCDVIINRYEKFTGKEAIKL